MGIALDYQLHRTSVDMAKGYRQMQKAANALSKVSFDVEAKRDRFVGTLDWSYDGALLFLKLNF